MIASTISFFLFKHASYLCAYYIDGTDCELLFFFFCDAASL